MEEQKEQVKQAEQSKFMKYAKKLGWAGFFFFLIKGLIWLGIFYGLGSVFV